MGRRVVFLKKAEFSLVRMRLLLNPEARRAFEEIQDPAERMRVARIINFEKALFEEYADESQPTETEPVPPPQAVHDGRCCESRCA